MGNVEWLIVFLESPKVHPSLMDVQVLMAVQLLVEFARDFQDHSFLHNVYQYILFDMRIWGRSQFHVRIGELSNFC